MGDDPRVFSRRRRSVPLVAAASPAPQAEVRFDNEIGGYVCRVPEMEPGPHALEGRVAPTVADRVLAKLRRCRLAHLAPRLILVAARPAEPDSAFVYSHGRKRVAVFEVLTQHTISLQTFSILIFVDVDRGVRHVVDCFVRPLTPDSGERLGCGTFASARAANGELFERPMVGRRAWGMVISYGSSSQLSAGPHPLLGGEANEADPLCLLSTTPCEVWPPPTFILTFGNVWPAPAWRGLHGRLFVDSWGPVADLKTDPRRSGMESLCWTHADGPPELPYGMRHAWGSGFRHLDAQELAINSDLWSGLSAIVASSWATSVEYALRELAASLRGLWLPQLGSPSAWTSAMASAEPGCTISKGWSDGKGAKGSTPLSNDGSLRDDCNGGSQPSWDGV